MEQKQLLVLARKLARNEKIVEAKTALYAAAKLAPLTDAQRRAFVRALPKDKPLEWYYQEPKEG